jgi:hypothetical protein
MLKSDTSSFRSVPRDGHVADRSPASQTGWAGLEAATIGHRAGDAYMLLWEIVNEVERERRSEQRKYPPDRSRIDRLLELQTRILFTLLPYEQPKLLSIAPPPKPPPGDLSKLLSKLTTKDLRALQRLALKAQS